MSAVWTWVRYDLRRRWISLVVLALLVALVVGVAAAALAGARRGASALDRLQESTLGMDAIIAANPEIQYPWAEFDELPYVEGRWGLVWTAGIKAEGFHTTDWLTTPADESFGTTIERVVVFDGRMYDPGTPDELFVSREFAEENDIGVGDAVDVRLPTREQAQEAMESFDNVVDPQGPRVRWQVVGIGNSPWLAPEALSPEGKAVLSPATLTEYAPNLLGGMPVEELEIVSGFRLTNARTDIAKLTAGARRLANSPDVDVWNIEERYFKPARDASRFEALTLAAFGALALLTGAFLVGSAIARSAATEAIELRKGLAIGMTPHQVSLGASIATTLAGALGAAGGIVAAIVASRWFPIGSTRLIEPDPGVSYDWLVLPVALLVSAAFAAAVAFAAARRQVAADPATQKVRPSALAARLSDLSAPVPTVMGTRLALETSPGRNAVPVRPAQFGAVLAVLGTIAVLVFSAGVRDALDNPERFGQVQQVDAFIGFGGETFVPVEEALPALASLDYVDGVWSALQGNATADGDQLSLIVYSGQTDTGALTPTLFDGRLPESQDEVLLALRTARALDVEPGDTVELDGSKEERALKVVGVGFLPKGAHNGYADGAYVTESGYAQLFGDDFHFHGLFAVSDGLSADTFAERLAQDLPGLGEQFTQPQPLDEVTQLRTVQRFPVALAIFLGVLGIGVVANALVLAVRRRVGELAVLRAVGMTGRQTGATVLTQALVLILVGLGFGIPLGLAVGRLAWRAVASFVPIEHVAPDWGMPLLYVSAAALVLALVLALVPARRASRFQIAPVLRAE